MVRVAYALAIDFVMPFLRMRLALHGCVNRPFYHIVVSQNTSKRDGKHLEQVGCYDPMPNYNNEVVVGLNLERIKYWLGVGAIPTVAVHRLLGLGGVTPKHPRLYLEAARNRHSKMEEVWGGGRDVDGEDSEETSPEEPEMIPEPAEDSA